MRSADASIPPTGIRDGSSPALLGFDPDVVERETQVAGELLPVGEQTLHRGRECPGVVLGEGVDSRLDGPLLYGR